ncbi:MAG: hypothetical protein P794_07315 [Epsilonproteobacteria bacterium (ex Lamellibrachia satsuma)]|nr:MAG: hypothetical protein P794_07315 [Epsilonproteobacteria bacterium (ex Lamellibrachia satsuma)]
MRSVLLFILLFSVLFSSEIRLTEKQANFIAKKVWQNEGAGKDKYLIWWNKGEDFASLGIGHFIWFSKGHIERFREVFPMVVEYMQKNGAKLPAWLTPKTDLPWNSKTAFFAAKKAKTKQYMELFNFLRSTFPLQASFMANRLSQALPQMLETIDDPKKQDVIKRRFYEVMHNADGSVNEQGLYVLLDYTNFKGEGTLKSERYKGQGWGLLQVLWNMDDKKSDKCKAFAESAKRMLSRRIKNSPPARGEERWRKGWNVRLDTYWK